MVTTGIAAAKGAITAGSRPQPNPNPNPEEVSANVDEVPATTEAVARLKEAVRKTPVPRTVSKESEELDSTLAPMDQEINPAAAPALEPGNWPDILSALKLSGVTQTLAANCQLAFGNRHRCVLKLAEHHASLWNTSHEERISSALSRLYNGEIKVAIEVGETDVETPAQQDQRLRAESQARAEEEIKNDEHVQQLIESFNGRLDPDSIEPIRRVGEQ